MSKMNFDQFLDKAFPVRNPFTRNHFGGVTNTIKYFAVRTSFILYRLGVTANQISLFSALLAIPAFVIIYQATVEEANILKFIVGYLLMGTVLFIDFVDGPLSKTIKYQYAVGEILKTYESILSKSPYLCGDKVTLADMALLPFIRQGAYVDLNWFNAQFPILSTWLKIFKESELFETIMKKYTVWKSGEDGILIQKHYARNE